jgi:hypothetical protein
MRSWLRTLALWVSPLLLVAAGAQAHPFVEFQPFPIANVNAGSPYVLTLDIFPGDTPVVSVQLDFEISAPGVFGPLSALVGDGFTLIYDETADPLHFSLVGDFSADPLPAFSEFPIAEVSMLAGPFGGELILLDSSVIVALELGVPTEFDRESFSAVRPSPVVANVVPEPAAGAQTGAGLLALVALRLRRARASSARS